MTVPLSCHFRLQSPLVSLDWLTKAVEKGPAGNEKEGTTVLCSITSLWQHCNQCLLSSHFMLQPSLVSLDWFVQAVEKGPAANEEEGTTVLCSITPLWEHCSHAMLGQLKAQQENLLNRHEDALGTVEPFLSGCAKPCWALHQAVWAHWLGGDACKVSNMQGRRTRSGTNPSETRSHVCCITCTVSEEMAADEQC